MAHAALRVMPRTLILANFAIVVIGASVGGVAAMRKLVAMPAIAEEDSHNGKFKSALELEAGAEQARERAEMVRNTLQSEWVQPGQFWEKRES
jgi:hypothetical protein